MVIAMLSPVSPSATGKTLRSFTSCRRASSSAYAAATALRNRSRLGSGTTRFYTGTPDRFQPERAKEAATKVVWAGWRLRLNGFGHFAGLEATRAYVFP